MTASDDPAFLYHQHHYVGSIHLARRSGGATFGVTYLMVTHPASPSFPSGVHYITRSERKAKVHFKQFQSRHGLSTRPDIRACSSAPLRLVSILALSIYRDGYGVSGYSWRSLSHSTAKSRCVNHLMICILRYLVAPPILGSQFHEDTCTSSSSKR